MDKQHIVNLSGKDFVLYAGLLAEAHERGLQAIETELLQIPNEANNQTAIVKATVRMKDGSYFEELGDANPKNTGARVATALIRMAATRSKGRALRDAINVGVTMLEELDEEAQSHAPAAPRNPHAAARTAGEGNGARAGSDVGVRKGFEATYSAAGTRQWTRTELIAEAKTLADRATALGMKLKPEALKFDEATNEALLSLVDALRKRIDATVAEQQAGAEVAA